MTTTTPAVKLSVSGFRAEVGAGFTPASVLRFASAYAVLLGERHQGTVVVGRDTRPSGVAAAATTIGALLAAGLSVEDVQVVPTPTAFYAAAVLEADGALMITASHNPPEWNGIEAAGPRGRLLRQAERERLHHLWEVHAAQVSPWDRQGIYRQRADAVEHHIAGILALPFVDQEMVRSRGLRVVLDAGNGAGAVATPLLLRQLGCQVIPLHCETNGRFARSPEPSPAALEPLVQTVVQTGADLGLAHDGDADRLVLVDEQGHVVPEEYTVALVAEEILKETPGPIVTTVVTGGLLDAVARRFGVSLSRTAVGVAHVVEQMEAVGAVVGGESTGGVIVPQLHRTTDGLAAAAIVLSGLARRKTPLSAWIEEWPRFWLRRAKLPLRESCPLEPVYAAVQALYPSASATRTDGLRLEVDPDSWIAVRPSGTEPVVRVFAESNDPSRAEALLKRAVQSVEKVLANSQLG